jgi:hypothetical protein
MISQKCPKCLSNRVRRGYRPTPLWSKILFRYNLLCDNCNWEFTGFAVPGTVSAKPTKSPKKKHTGRLSENLAEAAVDNSVGNLQNEPSEAAVSIDSLAGQNVSARKKSQS